MTGSDLDSDRRSDLDSDRRSDLDSDRCSDLDSDHNAAPPQRRRFQARIAGCAHSPVRRIADLAIVFGKSPEHCPIREITFEIENCWGFREEFPMGAKRVFVQGLSVHVIQRGNNAISIFHDDADRRLFLRYVRDAVTDNGVEMHAFVLMSTHWHGLVTPASRSALPAAMKSIGEQYVRYFNRKYDRFGTLWGGRYRPLWIRDETYWLTCLRYIEQNPVRAKIVSTPGDYQWSSYRAHAFGEGLEWLSPHPVYNGLGSSDVVRQANYRAICGVMLGAGELATQRHPEPLPLLCESPAENVAAV